MSGDNIRVYFYNGEWREFSYLHEYHGVTYTRSTPAQVYDNSLNPYDGWFENDTSNHDYWLCYDEPDIDGRTGIWYTKNDLPYWIKLNGKYGVYLISQLLQLDTYIMQSSEMYDYNGALTSFDYMHNNFGITHTPSTIYYVKNDIIKCWYNPDINQYWDVDTIRWYNDPPEYGDDDGSINSIGATGLFLYYSVTGQPTHYGTLVDGHRLTPVCINMPSSGAAACQRHSIEITGTWKLLTEVSVTSATKPSIVFATKIYEDAQSEGSQDSATYSSSTPAELFDI